MTDSCHDRRIQGPCDPTDLEARRPENRPGLDEIHYRISRHGDFLGRMLHALPREIARDKATGVETTPLRGLTTRTTDDPTIALADAFACTLDVLTFYQERNANEGYIRTATERMSVLELTRAIDYELRPGVAASASLAFRVEDADDPYRVVEIPVGVGVMSIPDKPGLLPQTFETIEAITARAEWNAIPSRTERPQNIALYWNAGNTSDANNGQLFLLDLDNSFDLDEADPADLVTIGAGDTARYFVLTPGLDLDQVLAQRTSDAAFNPEIEVVVRGLRVEAIEVRGLGLGLAVGGRVLAVATRPGPGGGAPLVRTQAFRIDDVDEDRAYNLTRVQLSEIEAPPAPRKRLKLRFRPPRLRIGRPIAQTVPFNAISAVSMIGRATWTGAALTAFVRTQAWPRIKLMRLFRQKPDVVAPAVGEATPGFYNLRQAMAFFGAGAAKWETLAKADNTKGGTGAGDPYNVSWEPTGGPRLVWENSQGVANTAFDIYLERDTPEATPGGWTLFEAPGGKTRAFRIAATGNLSRADFGLSGKTTGLTMRDPDGSELTVWNGQNQAQGDLGDYNFRTATARVGSQLLELGGLPIRDAIEAGETELSLDNLYLDLHPGVSISITGERADTPGIIEDEACTLKDVVHVGGFTRLSLVDGLQYSYVRPTVRVNANVALATHGETTEEPLGSGEATKPNQAFKLTKPPLTFIAASTDSGAASTLQVRVDGILWAEIASLLDAGPNDEVYVVRIDDDGATRVVFGDGVHGKRLPTGALNVRALYRSGMGVLGNVGDETLSLLKKRPLGVRSVINPSAAKGAAAAESLDEARARGPQSVRTLGRIVSLTDYEDFARSFAGIGKAKATALWRNRRRLVHLTVSPAVEGVFDADDETLARLALAIRDRRDPAQALIIAPHTPRYFALAAKVAYDPRYLADDVKAAIEARLVTVFGYQARNLAQSVSAAEVIAAIQGVAGVDHLDLDHLEPFTEGQGPLAGDLEAVLPARPARLAAAGAGVAASPDVEPAELLTLLPSGVTLTLEKADA
jgi:hypothetical protein